MGDQDLRNAIIDWLDFERQEAISAAAEVGIPSCVEVRRTAVTTFDETNAFYSYEGELVSPVAIPELGWRMKLRARNEGRIRGLAHELYEQFGEKCHCYMGAEETSFAKNAEIWIMDQLLGAVMIAYLSKLRSLEESSPQHARELAESLLQLIEGDTVTRVDLLPVAGLRLEAGSLTSSDFSVRPLSAEEIGDLSDANHDFFRPWNTRLPRTIPRNIHERVAIEVRSHFGKLERPEAEAKLARFVIGLQLLGFQPNGVGRGAYWTEPVPHAVTGSVRVRLPPSGETKSFDKAALERAVSLSELIPEGAVDAPKTRQELTLHRFHLGAADESPADRLLDFVIALEAFLLPPTRGGELGFRFALYGAKYLGGKGEAVGETFRRLDSVYGMRSKVVHGSKPPEREDLQEAGETAYELARRILVKGLSEGWPEPDGLKAMALRT